MKFLIPLLLFALPSFGGWVINTNLPTATDTEISVQGSEIKYLNSLATLTNGTTHVFIGYRDPGSWEANPYQIWHVNLSSNTTEVINGSYGVSSQYGVGMSTNGILVVGGSTPAYIWAYDLINAETNLFSTTNRAYQSGSVGWDGHIYLGSYWYGNVDDYDPQAKTVKSWGQLDPDVVYGEWTYGYSIGGDANYIYGSLRNVHEDPSWEYLGIIRKSDTNHTVLWKDAAVGATVMVYKGMSGQHYVNRITNSVSGWWILTNDTPVYIGTSQPSYQGYPAGMVTFDYNWSSVGGWDVEYTSGPFNVGGTVVSPSMRYKTTASGEWSAALVQSNNWITGKWPIDILKPWFDGQMFWMARAYGPVGKLAANDSTTLLGGYKYISTEDALLVNANTVYLAGYYQSVMVWNPSLPWTMEAFEVDVMATNLNPRVLYHPMGIYPDVLALASDGKIFCGVRHERTSTGGELSWYNPATGVTSSNRVDFEEYSCRDLKAAIGGTKMVYAGENRITVVNASTCDIETNMTLLGSRVISKITEYESGKFFGADSTGTNIFAFTTTGSLLYSNNLPASLRLWNNAIFNSYYYKRRMETGPDGGVWMCADNKLYRFEPSDGSYSNVVNVASNLNVTWSGGDAYLYGGTEVYKLDNLLTSSGSANTTINTVRVNNLILR